MHRRAAALLCACATAPAPGPAQPRTAGALDLSDLDGRPVGAAAWRGRVTLVWLFTTWSLAAQEEAGRVQRLADRLGDRAGVVGVALDPEGAVLVRPWIAVVGVRFPVLLAGADVREGRSPLGHTRQVPRLVVLDGAGRIATEFHGMPETERVVAAARAAGGG